MSQVMKRSLLPVYFYCVLMVGCAASRVKVSRIVPVVADNEPTLGIPKHCVTAMMNDKNKPCKDLGNGWWECPTILVKSACVEYLQPK